MYVIYFPLSPLFRFFRFPLSQLSTHLGLLACVVCCAGRQYGDESALHKNLDPYYYYGGP